jgi:hypothetical protein
MCFLTILARIHSSLWYLCSLLRGVLGSLGIAKHWQCRLSRCRPFTRIRCRSRLILSRTALKPFCSLSLALPNLISRLLCPFFFFTAVRKPWWSDEPLSTDYHAVHLHFMRLRSKKIKMLLSLTTVLPYTVQIMESNLNLHISFS